MQAPRILVITPQSCWPGKTGGEVRSGRIAMAMAKYSKVRVLSLYQKMPLRTPPGLEEIVMRPDAGLKLWSMRNEDAPLAPMVPEAMISRINQHIAEFKPEIVFFEETITTGFLKKLDLANIQTVFSTQNVDSDNFEQNEGNSPSSVISARSQETFSVRETDFLLACSERDAELFRQMTGKEAYVLKNPIPDEKCFDLPISPERYDQAAFIYVGSMIYPPTPRPVPG